MSQTNIWSEVLPTNLLQKHTRSEGLNIPNVNQSQKSTEHKPNKI